MNMLDYGVSVSFATDIDHSNSYSYTVTKWGEATVAPGKKWSLPVQALSEAMCEYVTVAPVTKSGDAQFEKKIVNWSSLNTQKLLEFNDQYFIQVLVEKEPINIVNNGMNTIEYVYNIVLLPTVTFYNYLPYPVVYEVSNSLSAVFNQFSFEHFYNFFLMF
jgi:hypothetical protein